MRWVPDVARLLILIVLALGGTGAHSPTYVNVDIPAPPPTEGPLEITDELGAILAATPATFSYPVGPPYQTEKRFDDLWYVAQDFGECTAPVSSCPTKRHLGEDWNKEGDPDDDAGAPVHAIYAGTVVFSESPSCVWGRVVIVKHTFPDGSLLWSQYGHLSDGLPVGTLVARQDILGRIRKKTTCGTNTVPAHLHFEVRTIDPKASDQPAGPGYAASTSGRLHPHFLLDEALVFRSDRTADAEIYVAPMNPNAAYLRNVTNRTGYDSSPCWSHDGNSVTFFSNREGFLAIYRLRLTVRPSEAKLSRLTERAHLPREWYDACLSAGDRLLFVSAKDGNEEIYVRYPDGTLQRLTNHPAIDLLPSWSPDDQEIVFASNRDGDFEIFLMDKNGLNLRRRTNNTVNDAGPRFSPSGGSIAFFRFDFGTWDIYTMRKDGSNVRRLTSSPDDEISPAWSPAGDRIAYNRLVAGNWEIFVMKPDGAQQRNVTNRSGVDWLPSWSAR